MKKPQGFTLIEMMAVVLISGILLGISINGLQRLLANIRATAAINQLAGAVHLTRQAALSQRRLTTLCPTDNQKTCATNWSAGMLITSGNGSPLAAYPPTPHGRIEWRSFGGSTRLQFAASGLTHAQNGTFIYCPEDKDVRHAKALVINKAGRARMAEDLDGNGVVDLRAGEPVQCT
jgi:type IV fimbrial biogenesis protein FimT